MLVHAGIVIAFLMTFCHAGTYGHTTPSLCLSTLVPRQKSTCKLN